MALIITLNIQADTRRLHQSLRVNLMNNVFQTIEWEIRGIPLWLIREYLREMGGQVIDDTLIEGQGWTVSLSQMEDEQIGSIHVGRVQLTLKARANVVEQIKTTLEKKLIRGGG